MKIKNFKIFKKRKNAKKLEKISTTFLHKKKFNEVNTGCPTFTNPHKFSHKG